MIKQFIIDHKKIIKVLLFIIAAPFIMYCLTTLVSVVFTIGNYVGTFLRGIYTYFVC